MATNIKFHRITATSGSNINTGTNYTKGDVYFIKSATGNTGKVYICTVAGKGAAATLEDYSVDTNTWRPVVNNLTSTSADSSLSAAMGKSLNDSITSLSNSLASHTHKYAGSSTAGGNATKADSIATERGASNSYRNVFFAYEGDKTKVVYDDDFTYNPSTNTLKIGSGTITATNYSGNAATATTATKIGTSTVGSTSLPVYIKAGVPTTITSFPEAYLSWGGKNFAASYGPIDAAMIPDLGACRSMFALAAGITIQYSRNGGSTWVDYGCTDTQKTGLFSVGHGIVIGGTTETGIDKSKYKLRVIVTTDLARIYTTLNKIAIYVSTSGSTGSNVTIDARTKANVDAGSDTWTTLADSVPVNGWSGWNIINIPDTTTYGNSSTQYQQIRFTFGVTSHASTVAYLGLSVSRIMMFGGVGWVVPSNMARDGHLYAYDSSQNATFPAAITSTKFVKSGGTSSQFLKADGSVDSSTYTKSGHTHDDRYYTESEIDTKLAAKSNTGHTHTKSQITDFAHTHTKSDITDFAHNHDDRYYTESEVNNLLANKSNTSHTHSYIVTQGDNRSVATKPSDYSNRITFAGLKTNSTIGSPSSTTYNYVVGLRGWSDTSGGKAHELAFNDNGIFHRIGATDTWESWDQLETKGNTTGYLNKISKSGNTLTITPKDGTAFTFTNTTYSRKWDDNLSNANYPGYGDATSTDDSFSLVNVGDMKRWNKASYMLEGLETLLASI